MLPELLETLAQALDRHTIPYVVTGSPSAHPRAKPTRKGTHIGLIVGVDAERLQDIVSLAAEFTRQPAAAGGSAAAG